MYVDMLIGTPSYKQQYQHAPSIIKIDQNHKIRFLRTFLLTHAHKSWTTFCSHATVASATIPAQGEEATDGTGSNPGGNPGEHPGDNPGEEQGATTVGDVREEMVLEVDNRRALVLPDIKLFSFIFLVLMSCIIDSSCSDKGCMALFWYVDRPTRSMLWFWVTCKHPKRFSSKNKKSKQKIKTKKSENQNKNKDSKTRSTTTTLRTSQGMRVPIIQVWHGVSTHNALLVVGWIVGRRYLW
jgi:hypothetical protein